MDNRQSMQFKTSMHAGEVYMALRRFEHSYEGATSVFAKQYQYFTMIVKCALRTHTNNAPESFFIHKWHVNISRFLDWNKPLILSL